MLVTTISPKELSRRMDCGSEIELVDVRTPVEFREVHVAGAKNVPLDRLDPKRVESDLRGAVEEPLYVVCHRGGRSKQACEKLQEAGFTNVFNVEGGTEACVSEGLTIVRGKKSLSLERQVRIAAGSLVLLGVGLSVMVTPYFLGLGLSAFVGAGLLFAGITDACGMGMLLAKMPWNQCGASCQN